MIDMLKEIEAQILAAPLTNPEILVQAQNLNRATQELTDRLFAEQISGDEYHSQMMALLDGVPRNVVNTATKINQFVAAEMSRTSKKDRSY